MSSFINPSEPPYSTGISRSSRTFPAIAPAAVPVAVHFRPDPSPSSVAISSNPTSNSTHSAKHFRSSFRNYYSNSDPTFSDSDDDGDYFDGSEPETAFDGDGGVRIKIEKLGNNSRRICSMIGIDSPLEAVWNVLTDYERLADFIPGLAISQIVYRDGNHARLFQVGQQDLAFGLKFNAKGTIDCYENDLERFPLGIKRVIKFNMIEGDFELFEGEWSIEQFDKDKEDDNLQDEELQLHTILSYTVDVKPKLFLPVRLLEGRLCDEIKVNLMCIQAEVYRAASTIC